MGQPHERTLHGLEEVHGRRPSPRCGGQRLLGPQERADGGARGGLQHSVEGLLLRVEGHSGGACGTDQDALVRLFEFCPVKARPHVNHLSVPSARPDGVPPQCCPGPDTRQGGLSEQREVTSEAASHTRTCSSKDNARRPPNRRGERQAGRRCVWDTHRE